MAKSSFLGNIFTREAESEADVVYPWELPSIMRKHIVTGAMGMIHFALLSGIFLTTFGNLLGMQYWQWGLLASLSSFTLVFQLLSAHIVGRTGSRKGLWFAAALFSRILRAGAIVAAYFLFHSSQPLARVAFMGVLILSNCLAAIAAPPWFSWLADLIPEEGHGRFMGRRRAWIALANLCVVVPIGYALDRFGGRSQMCSLLAVFAVGFVLGLTDLFIHRTIPEPPMSKPPRKSLWRGLLVPLEDHRFRPWLVFNGLWTFGMTLGGSLAVLYFVENLGIKRNFFGGSLVLILVPLASAVLTAPWSGALIDRCGVKPVLRVGHTFWALLPLFWMLATPRTALLWLAPAAVIGGVASEAALNAATKLITRLRSPGHVPMYMAASTCVGCLTGGLGSLLAGILLQIFGDATWQVCGVTVVGFHALFLVSFVLRLGATLAIRRIPSGNMNHGP